MIKSTVDKFKDTIARVYSQLQKSPKVPWEKLTDHRNVKSVLDDLQELENAVCNIRHFVRGASGVLNVCMVKICI